MKSTLFLASASPRRHELLQQIGIPHTVLHVPSPPGDDEPRYPTESPLEYVQRTANDKALRAQAWITQQQNQNKLLGDQIAILTADTVVALDDLVLGKPSNEEDAKHTLRMLSGKTHIVYTALVLSLITNNVDQEWRQSQKLSTTRVSFTELTHESIKEYIATKEPFGKAGAYGIQGRAAQFINRIEGSYSGVMGLPLFETSELIKMLIKK